MYKRSSLKSAFTSALLVASIATMSGCASLGEKIARDIEGRFLNQYVGKSYASLKNERPTLGKLIAREELPDGSTVMKHLGDGGQSQSSIMGIYGTKTNTMKATYIKVKDNIVQDFGTGLMQGAKTTCWVGICGRLDKDDPANVDISALDQIVMSGDGQAIASWR